MKAIPIIFPQKEGNNAEENVSYGHPNSLYT
jgi:hypothetical protein